MGVLGAQWDGPSVLYAHVLRQVGGTLAAANQVYKCDSLCFCSRFFSGLIVDPTDMGTAGVY